jgi:molybdate transport system substrate-binding protein
MKPLVTVLIVLAVLAVVVLLFWPFQRPMPASGRAVPEVRVAAAADLRFALEDILGACRAVHPDIQVKVTYGASGEFYAHLSNHGPFDLFLSADMDYPRRLAEAGLADQDTLFRYAVGRLVVWVPRSSPLDVQGLDIELLLHPTVKKIAIANPRHAPYGRAAEAALKHFQIYEKVRDRLVLGENIAQAAQFAQSGAADAGLLALSLALSPVLRDSGSFWQVPPEAHPRLDQGGVIMNWAQDREAADTFRAFLMSREGKAVLRRHGFAVPGEE